MSRRKRHKRRLLWAGVFLALCVLALIGIVIRATETLTSAARGLRLAHPATR